MLDLCKPYVVLYVIVDLLSDAEFKIANSLDVALSCLTLLTLLVITTTCSSMSAERGAILLLVFSLDWLKLPDKNLVHLLSTPKWFEPRSVDLLHVFQRVERYVRLAPFLTVLAIAIWIVSIRGVFNDLVRLDRTQRCPIHMEPVEVARRLAPRNLKNLSLPQSFRAIPRPLGHIRCQSCLARLGQSERPSLVLCWILPQCAVRILNCIHQLRLQFNVSLLLGLLLLTLPFLVPHFEVMHFWWLSLVRPSCLLLGHSRSISQNRWLISSIYGRIIWCDELTFHVCNDALPWIRCLDMDPAHLSSWCNFIRIINGLLSHCLLLALIWLHLNSIYLIY